MMVIPDWVRRHLKAEPPLDCGVPADAIPALIEGHIDTAAVATIGINPHGPWSRYNYSPKGKLELDEQGIADLWERKQQYFEENPRYGYFSQLESILNECGASYGGVYDSKHPCSAVSIDVVQWPTPPTWGSVPKNCQLKLIDESKALLECQLTANPDIKLLIGNGKRVKEGLSRFGLQVDEVVPKFNFSTRRGKYKLYCGELWGRQFIGWSAFLSRSGLTKEQMTNLAERVGELAGDVCRA